MTAIFPREEDELNFTKPRLKAGFHRPGCRWCNGECRALNNNGVIGPGYREWNYVCNHCGRVQ